MHEMKRMVRVGRRIKRLFYSSSNKTLRLTRIQLVRLLRGLAPAPPPGCARPVVDFTHACMETRFNPFNWNGSAPAWLRPLPSFVRRWSRRYPECNCCCRGPRCCARTVRPRRTAGWPGRTAWTQMGSRRDRSPGRPGLCRRPPCSWLTATRIAPQRAAPWR